MVSEQSLRDLPLSVIKNGIRIATLTLLGLYVNPDVLRDLFTAKVGLSSSFWRS